MQYNHNINAYKVIDVEWIHLGRHDFKSIHSCPSADGRPETMKMVPLLSKEGSGVVERSAHHPLPPPPPRKGIIFKAVTHARPLMGTQKL